MIIWLASYPKSGNTWLRSLIASYFYQKDSDFNFDLLNFIDQFPSVNYFKKYNDAFLQPESTAEYWIKEQESINEDKKLRFFKTHNALCKINNFSFTDSKNTIAAIHIVRDPRNVVTSLSNHYQINKNEAFDFMKNEKKALIEKKNNKFLGFVPLFSWKFHQESWSECKKFPVLTIRYEDLQADTFKTFKSILSFLRDTTNSNIDINSDKINQVIKSCEFEKLQKLEKDGGFKEALVSKKTNEKIKFFNLGKKNDFRNLLDKKMINEMTEFYKDQIKKYKYE